MLINQDTGNDRLDRSAHRREGVEGRLKPRQWVKGQEPGFGGSLRLRGCVGRGQKLGGWGHAKKMGPHFNPPPPASVRQSSLAGLSQTPLSGPGNVAGEALLPLQGG